MNKLAEMESRLKHVAGLEPIIENIDLRQLTTILLMTTGETTYTTKGKAIVEAVKELFARYRLPLYGTFKSRKEEL